MAGVESVAPPPPGARAAKGGKPWLTSVSPSCRGTGSSACSSLSPIAGAGAFYYFYEMPQQAEIAAQAKRAERRSAAASARARRRRASCRSSARRSATLEARLEALKPILPEEKDVGDLLRRVQTLATQSNLQIRGFRPQAITTKEMHAEWPIALQLEGNYHNLGLFLDRVSKFPRIINIGEPRRSPRRTTPTAGVDA